MSTQPSPPFGPGRGFEVLRGAIVAVGVAIALVLLDRGDVVLGTLLLAFAGLRLVAMVGGRRRRRERRARWEARRAGLPPR
jgi:hypothetical protein